MQCMLLKICLVLGVKFHSPVAFVDIVEPLSSDDDWHVAVEPTDSPLCSVFSADGKQQNLKGFASKLFRAQLAIAVTANFVRRRTKEDACVNDVGGL